MKVYFRNNWFSPRAQLVKKSKDAHDLREIPEEWEKKLPKSCKIISRGEQLAPKPLPEVKRPEEPATPVDIARREAEHLAEVSRDTAEGNSEPSQSVPELTPEEKAEIARQERAKEFQRQLQAEQADLDAAAGKASNPPPPAAPAKPGRPRKS